MRQANLSTQGCGDGARSRCRCVAWALAAIAVCLALPATASAEVIVPPYGSDDAGGFRNILPAGEGGLDNATELAEYKATGAMPPHFTDQLGMYANLLYASPTLTHEQIPEFFKDATFGVKEGELASSESPRSDVVIERDRDYGVPHIYASTRGGVMFGAGYAAAEDRLFLMDVLRHSARAELSSFVGGAAGNRAMDRYQWFVAPYTEADLQSQVEALPKLYGAEGAQVVSDATEFVAGINAYIKEGLIDPNKMPAEYAALNKTPAEWKVTDIIAEASLIGAIYGRGGGGEVASAIGLEAFEKRFGQAAGRAVWEGFREHDDPEAPTTISKPFNYETGPAFAKRGLALPDPGSVNWLDDGEELNAPAGASKAGPLGSNPFAGAASDQSIPHDGSIGSQLLHDALGPPHASNWELISASHSSDGHPIAVMGPQVGYYTPEILMEEDLHGPGIDARGAAFPGTNLYVELGHGPDFAWSSTTSESDDTDTFAEVLCGDEYHYLYKGQCLAMEKLEKTNTWTPNASDQTPPGSEKLTIYRTVHGIVYARGAVGGKPVAFAADRTTYFHEADSALGFMRLNEPAYITGPKRFEEAASKVNFSFNFAYVDAKHIAYYLAGAYPERARGTSPDFPILGTGQYDWRGFDPATHTMALLPFKKHPHAIDPPFLVSWNNKAAPQWSSADSNFWFGPVQRMQRIRNFIETDLSGGKQMGTEQLISAMDEAATQDLRIIGLWPSLKQLLGTPSNPTLQKAIEELDAWYAAGGHRRDLANHDIESPGTYEHNEAITIMDAWWPKLLEAEFRPALGEAFPVTKRELLYFGGPYPGGEPEPPSFYAGWISWVNKDLRDLLAANGMGEAPALPFPRVYCGNGSLEACRSALLGSLQEALATTPAEIYGHGACAENPQASCFDMNRWTSASAISVPPFPFQNRPTFQQVVELTKTLPAAGTRNHSGAHARRHPHRAG